MQLGQLLQPPDVGQNLLPGSIISWPNMENLGNYRTIQKHHYHKNMSESKSKLNNQKIVDRRKFPTVKDINGKITKIKGKSNLLNVTHNKKSNVSTNNSTSGKKLTEGKHLRFSRAFYTLETKGNQRHLHRKHGQHGSTPNPLNDYPDPHLHLRPPPSPPMNPEETHGRDETYFPAEGGSHKYPPPDGDSSRTAPVGGSTSHALAPPGAIRYHNPHYPVSCTPW